MAQFSRIGLGNVGSYSKIGTVAAGAWSAGAGPRPFHASGMAHDRGDDGQVAQQLHGATR